MTRMDEGVAVNRHSRILAVGLRSTGTGRREPVPSAIHDSEGFLRDMCKHDRTLKCSIEDARETYKGKIVELLGYERDITRSEFVQLTN